MFPSGNQRFWRSNRPPANSFSGSSYNCATVPLMSQLNTRQGTAPYPLLNTGHDTPMMPYYGANQGNRPRVSSFNTDFSSNTSYSQGFYNRSGYFRTGFSNTSSSQTQLSCTQYTPVNRRPLPNPNRNQLRSPVRTNHHIKRSSPYKQRFHGGTAERQCTGSAHGSRSDQPRRNSDCHTGNTSSSNCKPRERRVKSVEGTLHNIQERKPAPKADKQGDSSDKDESTGVKSLSADKEVQKSQTVVEPVKCNESESERKTDTVPAEIDSETEEEKSGSKEYTSEVVSEMNRSIKDGNISGVESEGKARSEAEDEVDEESRVDSGGEEQEAVEDEEATDRATPSGNGGFMDDSFIDGVQQSNFLMSEDSSDDDLFGVDSVFSNLKTLSSRPAPSTPTKLFPKPPPMACGALTPERSDNDDSPENTLPVTIENEYKPEENGFNLDTLLEDKRKNDEVKKEMDMMIDSLKAGIQDGGMANLTEDEQATDGELDMAEDDKQQLQRLKVEEQVIMDQYPGETVFHSQSYRQLFDDKLTPAECGFLVGSTFLEKQIPALTQDMLIDMLTMGIFTHCIESFDTPLQFLNWLLYILSIHPSVLVIQKCSEVLYDVLRRNQGKCVEWAPRVKDVVRILVNYGCRCDRLTTDYTIEQLRFSSNSNHHNQMVGNNNPGYYGIENLRHLLRILTASVKHRPNKYNTKDLVKLISIVGNVSLDTRLNIETLKCEFQMCISVILDTIPEDLWQIVAEELCITLPNITTHHHNLVHTAELFPPTTRGVIIQRRLSLNILQMLLGLRDSFEATIIVKLEEIVETVRYMRVKNNTDFYRISNLIALIDLSVGNENLKSAEKTDLKRLEEILRNMTGDVRECINVLDRTMVKDSMVRLASKWVFMLQNMGTKQSTLFEWAHCSQDDSQEVNIETVDCTANTLDDLPSEEDEPYMR